MRKLLLISILTFLITSCENKKSDNFHPDIMKPNWDGIKTEKLKFKIGDVVSIFIDKQYYIGVVMDFNQDQAGIWYGICLSDYRWVVPNQKDISVLNFFARKIPSGFNGNCIDSYDLTYLNENSSTKNIRVVDNLKIDINKISIGASSPAKDLKQLESNYFNGIKVRQQKPTECGEEIMNSKRVAERYFNIDNALKE
jgi:hypothetical protein